MSNDAQAKAVMDYAEEKAGISPTPPLEQCEKALTEAAMVLSMTIDRASKQLDPLLRMEPVHEVSDSEKNEVDSRSQHVRALTSVTARLHEQNDRLTRLLDRLEV